MRAYYNENDPDAVAVLRELIVDGVIAPGDVDDRSIRDVQPGDLVGYSQCHFFAGGGLWSVAARMGGWPDARPLWTASCPCQPFSAAGNGLGADDPRHLWPDLFRLIRASRPAVVMGEQVAGAAGYGWLDGVGADLAGEDYASRGVDIPACAVDAPHQRNRLYWIAVADCDGAGWAERPRSCSERSGQREPANGPDVADMHGAGWQGQPNAGGVAECPPWRPDAQRADRRDGGYSFWADAEWITCHDGKARRTQPGLSLLVDGLPGRVGLWRLAGNAISPVLAAEVVGAFLETEVG